MLVIPLPNEVGMRVEMEGNQSKQSKGQKQKLRKEWNGEKREPIHVLSPR